jgi:hypothetical protein
MLTRAVAGAIAAAEQEQLQLVRRLDDARIRAIVSVGNETYEHETRQPEKAVQLVASESQMLRAEARMDELARHISRLKSIEHKIRE